MAYVQDEVRKLELRESARIKREWEEDEQSRRMAFHRQAAANCKQRLAGRLYGYASGVATVNVFLAPFALFIHGWVPGLVCSLSAAYWVWQARHARAVIRELEAADMGQIAYEEMEG